MTARLIWRPKTGLIVSMPAIAKADDLVAAMEQRFRAKLAASFLAAVEAVRSQVSLREIAANPYGLHISDLLGQALGGRGVQGKSFQTIFAEAVQWSGQRAAALMPMRAQKRSISDLLSFDLLSPQMVQFIRGYLFDLVTQISRDTAAMIQGVIGRGFTEGNAPAVQAREIKSMIGLTDRQATAVANYRNMLRSGDYRGAMARQLRDARFDPTLRRIADDGATLTREQIDRMTDRYVQRQLKYRAESIARTETIRAASSGQREAWRQAAEQGLLNQTARQKWILADDERTCKLCKSTVITNRDGVPIGGMFQTPLGPVDGPPLHPLCRCALGLIP